ncbi:hypothetical protein [Actinomycetospora chlora]|uniref:hypothetical protein n=1 Tax=Actinomycetospora chlora TaxID=663608 RepID=UPI0031E6C307
MRSLVVLAFVALSLFLVEAPSAGATSAASSQVWAARGTSSPAEKLVRLFPRASFVPGPAGTNSPLSCGTEAFGYRHISNRHGSDWQNIAVYTGENWRDLADFAIEQILTAPQPGYPRYNDKNDTWAFTAPLEIRDGDGRVRDVYHPVVVVAGSDGKVITAYPTRDPA